MGSNAKRMRGIAVHRPILVGSTATPLTPAEKATAPADHTHKWTIAVRSAASHPLPSIPPLVLNGTALNADGTPADEPSGGANGSATASAQPPASGAVVEDAAGGISTRGREVETDYHKMVGGRDDISHFIKRVQIKLHESFAQPTRNIDRPPYQVCETGWGEFDVQIKIFFIAESGEKPVTIFHRLKLHPWHPISIRAEPRTDGMGGEEEDGGDDEDDGEEEEDEKKHGQGERGTDTAAGATEGKTDGDKEIKEEGGEDGGSLRGASESLNKQQSEGAEDSSTAGAENSHSEIQTRTQTQLLHAANAPPPVVPPVVHSWGYDEIVFPEPTEAFYEILTAHPPTPLPASSLDAFQDPRALETYRKALSTLARDEGHAYDETGDEVPDGASGDKDSNGKAGSTTSRVVLPELQKEAFTRGIMPPHPLHNPTGAMLEALSAEAMEGEAYRIDRARVQAVRELEAQRERLIKGEKKLREGKRKLEKLLSGN